MIVMTKKMMMTFILLLSNFDYLDNKVITFQVVSSPFPPLFVVFDNDC